VSLSPADLDHPGLAVAASRAGGVGLLDFERVRDWTQAAANLRRLAQQTSGAIGLRIAAPQLAAHAELLDALAGREHWLIVANASPEDAAALAAEGRKLWMEITEGAAIRSFGASLDIAGFAGRGSECGGRPGRESALILAQHLARQERPFLVQGAIGPHNAAACLAAGAFGVIVDDSQLLLRESPLPPHRRALLERIGLHDTAVVDGIRVVDRPDFPAGDDAWALGESAGRAPDVARAYGTAGRYFQAIVEAADRSLTVAAERQPLAPDAPLARSHGTRYPIVQGPMTRVSDRVDFAAAVAANGGLPLIALALMRGPEVEKLLVEAQKTLAGQPWGIGILGFVPQELRQEQLAVVMRVRPPFALIAGGRPDQAAELEASGIATYLHVPAQLLPHFIEQGARRFIFEGGECGGHVGPLHSFALWESVIGILLRDVPAADSENVHVVFAGGIHDARSAAMVAAMAAPLVERGMKIGVLMGTAYLFCDEAVASGAITPPFQQQALRCEQTVTIETKPGHSIRCAPTPFIGTFEQKKSDLLSRGDSRSEAGDTLEALIAGRLRIASKGLERVGDELRRVDEERQGAEGMYMMGEVAALRSSRTTFAELHDDVSAGGARILAAAASARPRIESAAVPKPSAVAIVGIGCLVPGAHDVDALWRNLLDRKSAIGEVPRERWDWRLYYDEDVSARDKINSKWGGFIDPLPFDPLHFGIPPKSLSQISLTQLLVLELTRRALRDAGYGDFIADARVRERTGVALGVYNTGDLEQFYGARTLLPLLAGKPSEDTLRRLPEWSEESFSGFLANVVAGRVANRFDLGGPNVTLDAACASSLAALDLAVRELDEGRCDLMLTGGLDFDQTPQAFTAFSKTKALSPHGKARVFDRDADGIVISEGAGLMILKRLADAERDGDRIYAVIRAVAGSSDGKGLGLTAPKPSGQRRALHRAYERAGIDPATISMYEAHGTGTPVGDAAEAESIDVMLRARGAEPRSCVIGSAKSLLGHTRVAAGMVGLAKTALALHHRVLPPHAGVETPIAALERHDSPLQLLDEARPWLDGGAPRRAGVSAFGFGGTNYHVVVEEHRGDATGSAPLGANVWPAELFAASGSDRASLAAALDRLDRAAANEEIRLSDLALASVSAAAGGEERVAIVAGDRAELRRLIAAAKEGKDFPPGVHRGSGGAAGDVAFLFPGQGSQHVGMGGELSLYFDEVRAAFQAAGETLARAILAPAAFTDEARAQQERTLTDTRVAQPAIGVVSCGMLDLARRLGLSPARVAGHSYGELVALHAAGVIGRDDLMRLSAKRGELLAEADGGAMAVLSRPLHEVQALLPDGVVIANVNGPEQIVVSGSAPAVEGLAEGRRLNVSAAFHSPLMRPAREPFAATVNTLTFAPPAIPVHANYDGKPYPEDVGARLVEHLEQRVDFLAQVEAMIAAGVRTFVEIGPGRVLTGLVRRIAGDRAAAVATDGGLRGWLDAVAQLYARGVAVDLSRLFDGRALRAVDLERLPAEREKAGWMMDGGRVWRAGESHGTLGELPLLDADSPAALPQFEMPAAADATVIEVYRQYEETMRLFLQQQERVLAQIVGSAQGVAIAASPPLQLAPPPAAVAPPRSPRIEVAKTPEVPAALDRQALTEKLLAIVSDRTGYPADMLNLTSDLEAELGVDSIKRVEILTLLQKSLPDGPAAWFRTQLDRFTRVKSLGKLLDAVIEGMASAEDVPALAPPLTSVEECPRFLMRAGPSTLPPDGGAPRGLHIVTEDSLGVAPLVVAALRVRGAKAYLLKRDECETAEALERRLGVLRPVHGTVRAVLHLSALGLKDGGDPALWHDAAAIAARGFFRLVQLCASDFEEASGRPRVLAATRLGGAWGREAMTGSPAAGAVHGLVRTLQKEYPRVRGNVVDFDDSLSPEEIADLLIAELLGDGDDAEVGYRGTRRFTYLAGPAPLAAVPPSDAWRPAAGWVVLATGGARGITAQICRDLAAPGVRFVMVGRSPRREERFAELRAAGAEVEYHSVDVADTTAFGAFLDEVYARHGRIDAVLHGAGIIEDAWLTRKTEDSFARVFDTKAGSAFVLAQRLRPETLRWIVLFGSVSGRFGNQGQSDYAAANEVMNRIAWQMDARWPAARVAVINWGPWIGAGMAATATIELLAARGIRPIGSEAGRRFFAEELARGRKGEVEVIAGDGPWNAAQGAAVRQTEASEVV
jgi:acyl transferase domain-containing protein/NAD(P)H-dependent flavin oxidoreductase YrpB (nitropropane dioxygenase family)/NAD(P)-dependent dehydrogenase (short-subunit alcohol dehydrogenase family)